MTNDPNSNEKHLRVYSNRSEYHISSEDVDVYKEGIISNEAKKRIKKIKDAFENGFLDNIIVGLKNGAIVPNADKVSQETEANLRKLVELVTSEAGRALIGITVLQLSIKAIAPQQSIRLHKASSNRGSFSWVEGVSMRTLDKNYVTPTLRKHDLVRLNADGFMMTRSLAENYPYSFLYKAQMRGARDQWLSIVESLEKGQTDSYESLLLLLSLLLNSAGEFSSEAAKLVALCDQKIQYIQNRSEVQGILNSHAESSDYAARLLEISMHSLLQAAVASGALGDVNLKPLSQMRSANKKHGNVGDIELLEEREIIESWDAKYGKGYLREEIEEAAEKIPNHQSICTVGFVTNVEIQRTTELDQRIRDLTELHGVEFLIIPYTEWVSSIFVRCLDSTMISESELAKAWMQAYAYTLAQRKREVAPVDEPCLEWIRLLSKELEKFATNT